MTLKTGFAMRKITPEGPCVLAGYAPVREMKGVHDDLYVKALFFSVKDTVYGCIAYDLLAVDSLLTEPVVRCLEEKGIQKENVVISAIHTHSAPGGVLETRSGYLRTALDLAGEVDENLIGNILESTRKCIEEALLNMRDGEMFRMYGMCPGAGSNRNVREWEGNDSLLCFEIWSGGRKMMLVHFACHPTVLHAENQLCSADYPGALQKYMRAEGYEMIMFLNGSCGDISTRFTRKGNGFDEVERVGNLLAAKCVSLSEQKVPYEVYDIRVKRKKIVLRAKDALSMDEAERMLEIRQKEFEEGVEKGVSPVQKRLLESILEGAQADMRYAKNYDGEKEYEVELHFCRINSDIFVCIPGELFSRLSNPIQNENTHFIGYANGYMMYFADRNAYEQRYYEALSSPFAEGEAERMIDMVRNEIEEWRSQK